MASGNSGGSIQSSSSGGIDEAYDSRNQSISSFFNENPPDFGSLISSPHPKIPTPYNYNNPHIIPSVQNLDPFPQSTPSFHYNNNLNTSDGMIWSTATTQVNAVPPSSQTKNPKKRTRASRRAPTTVLTTDTTNFRQMVQEFTGIPTPLFPGSPYPSGASALRPGSHLVGLGPLYSLRPSSQDLSSNNPPLLSDQDLLNLRYHHDNSSLRPSIHGHRFEASGSIDFGSYLGGFRNQEIASASAGESVKNDDEIQEKFMPFDGKS